MELPQDAGAGDIEREIWLWDFGGQADYRLIHQLYMDETALAVFVFNPQSDDPFDGLGQWDRDLQRAARRAFSRLLVAGRCDRGGLMVSGESIERFANEHSFAGHLETSALTGAGCGELHGAIVRSIPWEEVPWTSSPRIFKLLKDAIISLKDEGKALIRMPELQQRIQTMLPNESFTEEQFRAVVGLLAGPGAVWKLEFGDFVLLQPARISSYAAAVIRSVRAHKEEIGCISEESVLAGDLDYQDMKRLLPEEEEIVLRAMHQTLVKHSLCFREPTEPGIQLVFPSYFKRERPELEEHPAVLVTYRFSGALDEIYATLIVRLIHTAAFKKDQLWRFAADFKTPESKQLGLRMTKKGEGEGEMIVYCDPTIPDDTKVTFIRYIHDHLKAKAAEVVRVRHYVCPECGETAEGSRAIRQRLEKGRKTVPCLFCDKSILLLDLIEKKFASDEAREDARELEEKARKRIDSESKELAIVSDAFSVAAQARQIFRRITASDWGLDGEIEFKDNKGNASGKRLYLQLKSGDSYLWNRKSDGTEVFRIRKERHADYWQQQAYPVMLVIRTSDGTVRWMDVRAYLKKESKGRKTPVKQIVFEGEPFTAESLLRMRQEMLK